MPITNPLTGLGYLPDLGPREYLLTGKFTVLKGQGKRLLYVHCKPGAFTNALPEATAN